MNKCLTLRNIRRLVGYKSDDTLLQEENVDMIIRDGKIAKIGREVEITENTEIDMTNRLVTPAFIDPHTHIFPPKDRSNEFAMRISKTY